MKIRIKVKPNAGKQEIIKIKKDEYKVSLREKAENNKANIELLKLLKKYFKREVKIVKGLKGRNKIVELK